MNDSIKTMQVVDKLTEREEKRRGEIIVALLNLKPIRGEQSNGAPVYRTQHGTKTALGLFRSVARLVIDGE
jgi:hypothetical protein